MKAALFRADSATLHASLLRQDSGTGISLSSAKSTHSAKCSLHFEMRSPDPNPTSFRRSMSDTELIRYTIKNSSDRTPSSLTVVRIAEEEDLSDEEMDLEKRWWVEQGAGEGGDGFAWDRSFLGLSISDPVTDMFQGKQEIWRAELESSGGGFGDGSRRYGGGNGGSGDSHADESKMGGYYQQMLKANPGNPLLLRNYGKFLHEVEKNYEKAEEYYGRAILASPGDGEVTSLYGKLIWETQRDQGRAQRYFHQAVQACPDDCYVLGSYAHFLWDADDDADNEEAEEVNEMKTQALVEAR